MKLQVALLTIATAVLVWSGIAPKDRFTWLLEVAPVLVVVPLLIATRRRFPLTPLLTVLIAVHAVILMVGGRYTYAEVPLGFAMQDLFGLARNPYDGIGHFAQGFVPAIAAREILLRRSPLSRGGWLVFTVISFCLAVSALYELIEWGAALGTGEAAEAFLGTQGDPWDTQKDMALALVGAVCALLSLSRLHDRALERLERLERLEPAA